MKHSITAAVALVCLAGAPALVAQQKEEKLEAYAEWRKGDALLVDGQRVRWQPKAKFKGEGAAKSFDTVPLGYEVTVKGVRQPDGSVLANELQAKPNGMAAFEKDVIDATNQMEQQWLKAGHVVEPSGDGKTTKDMGKLHTEGADVDRVRGIVARLIPPYLKVTQFRVYVVENKDWNAFACANGMIVVYDSLLHATNDDEMAIVLGHELVHATHEHSRKQMKSGMKWAPLGIGAQVLGGSSSKIAQAGGLAGAVGIGAIQNGYSRNHEDQADIVGLRYAHEGGFDVSQGPKLWKRFAEKYGDSDKVTNVLFGNHSRAVDRSRNLTQQIAWNYATPTTK